MAAKQFDRELVKPSGKKGRRFTYETENRVWFVECYIRQLPGGLFRSGEVWRYYVVKQDQFGQDPVRWRRFCSWEFDMERSDKILFSSKEHKLPEYVKDICQELSDILAHRFPVRGIGEGVPSEGGMRLGERTYQQTENDG